MGFLAGAFSGAAAGSVAGPVGGVIGFAVGGVMGAKEENDAQKLKAQTEKKINEARRDSISKEMEAKRQADSITLAGLKTTGANKPAGGSPEKLGGLMGQNLTTSGTF